MTLAEEARRSVLDAGLAAGLSAAGTCTARAWDGTRAVVEAAIRGGVKRFIYISSIHAFKQEPSGELLDETRAPVDDSAFAYDRSKYAGQQIALEANNHGMETIVVNPTSIIGPYDFKPSLLGQVIIDLYRGKLPFVFDGGFNFCDCRDIAGGILNACTRGRPGEQYLLGGKWYSLKQLVGYLSAASGKRIRVAALPEWVAKAGLPFVELWGKIRRQEPQYTIEAIEAHGGNSFADFSLPEAKRLVHKYFGPLKAGQPVPPVVVAQPRITAERRLVVTDRIELPRLTIAWHTPAQYSDGDAEMDVLANLLGGGKSSRLYKRLVYDRQIAQSVSATQDSMSLGSVFSIEVVARPGQSLDEIERVVEVRRAIDLEHRTKEFFVRRRKAGDVDDGGGFVRRLLLAAGGCL